jgi:hypothetical protein
MTEIFKQKRFLLFVNVLSPVVVSRRFSAPPAHAVDMLTLYIMSFHRAHRVAEESMPLAAVCVCVPAGLADWLLVYLAD